MRTTTKPMAPYCRNAVFFLSFGVSLALLAGAEAPRTNVRPRADNTRDKAKDPRAAPRPFSLEEDMTGWDFTFPPYLEQFVDRTYYPYKATDFFADPKVAELAEAARDGHLDRIDTLIRQGVNINARGNTPRTKAITPLMYAMSAKTLKGLERLLKRGADPNLQTDTGESAVTFAAERKDPEALKILLAHRGNPNLQSRSSLTGYKHESQPTPIYQAIACGRPENARLLIKAGADVNARASFGETPLIHAEGTRSYEAMYLLLEAGADFRAKDEFGMTLAYWMILHSDRTIEDPEIVKWRKKCIDFLEKKGLDFGKEKVEFAEFERRRIEEQQREQRELRQRGKEKAQTQKRAPQ